MTTQTRNDVAERLRNRMLEDGPPIGSMFWNGWDTAHDKIAQLLDDVLAAERRATVERIRRLATLASDDHGDPGYADITMDDLTAILDEEAAQ
jgi:hypothetical protein